MQNNWRNTHTHTQMINLIDSNSNMNEINPQTNQTLYRTHTHKPKSISAINSKIALLTLMLSKNESLQDFSIILEK